MESSRICRLPGVNTKQFAWVAQSFANFDNIEKTFLELLKDFLEMFKRFTTRQLHPDYELLNFKFRTFPATLDDLTL